MEISLTKNNHFQFGYNEEPFSKRRQDTDPWFVGYGSIGRPIGSFFEECLKASAEIASSTNKPIGICLSGGIDSELVAESFRLAKIPFTAIILKMPNNLNKHDVSWAERYFRKHQIPFRFYNIDILQFYNTEEFTTIVEQTKCFYPMLAVQMKLMKWASEEGFFPILGSSECYLERQKNNSWVMYEREIYSSLYSFQLLNRFEGLCGFFQWSPELMCAFLQDPLVKKMTNNELKDVNSSLEIKHLIYSQHFQIEKRPKYYGWETFAEAESQLRNHLITRFKSYMNEIKIPYDLILETLNPREKL